MSQSKNDVIKATLAQMFDRLEQIRQTERLLALERDRMSDQVRELTEMFDDEFDQPSLQGLHRGSNN